VLCRGAGNYFLFFKDAWGPQQRKYNLQGLVQVDINWMLILIDGNRDAALAKMAIKGAGCLLLFLLLFCEWNSTGDGLQMLKGGFTIIFNFYWNLEVGLVHQQALWECTIDF
jgi:hypothetical protein